MGFKKVTAASPKPIAVPKTVKEKYRILEKKNPDLKKLVEAFDLEIEL